MPTFSISINNKVIGTYAVKKTVITIGRSRTNTISITSKAISRNHVRIELTQKGWMIVDLGSLNGTYVNDIRINSAFLSDGDKISIGAYIIIFSQEPKPDIVVEHITAGSQVTSGRTPEVSPPATETAIVPPEEGVVSEQKRTVSMPAQKEQKSERTISSEIVKESIEEEHEIEEEKETHTAVISDSKDEKNIITSVLKDDPSKLSLEDKIKYAIIENPLISDEDLIVRLSSTKFGNTKVTKSELKEVLKKMGLDTKIKRYQYFLNA